jgi:hypothetical protein
MRVKYENIIIAVIVGFVVLKTCSKGDKFGTRTVTSVSKEWKKSPLDDLIKSLADEQNFTIILHDMDAEGSTYKHQYRTIIEHPDTVLTNNTNWLKVSDVFFEQHVDDMGMEVASKKDGVLHKEVAPAGYSNYVGNSKYGQWEQRNGSSFWSFYGRYAFMSSMFNMMAYPARRSYWNDYRGHYGTGRSYYGPSGSKVYGTKSYTSSTAGKNSSWGNKPSSFRSSVRSNVSRSASATKSRRYSSTNSYGKTSRSSSRTSRSTPMRSRSGGFGK